MGSFWQCTGLARHPRLEYAGAVYHVTARGNDRTAIFHTEEDRRHLLEVLACMMERYAVVLHAYVLMNNHFHLIVRTLEPNPSRFMHDVNTGWISALWGVSLAQIHGRQRPNEARDVAIYLCREVGAKPVGGIGAVLGIKSSVVSLAAKRMRQHIAADPELRKRLEAAKNERINVSKT